MCHASDYPIVSYRLGRPYFQTQGRLYRLNRLLGLQSGNTNVNRLP